MLSIIADGVIYSSMLSRILFYKNFQIIREMQARRPEAIIEFLKEHIKSKEHFYQLIEEYHNDDNIIPILKEEYGQLEQSSLHTDEKLKKALLNAHEIREKGFIRNEAQESTQKDQPFLDEYVEFVNHMDDLFILELATGSGTGLYPVAKTLRPNSRLICVDRSFDSVKIADAMADSLGLADRMCGFKAYFWNLPFPDETFDVVCMHFGLDPLMEVDRTIKEISRVLKPNGRFINLSNTDFYLNEKRFYDFLDIPESEYKSLYRKSRLYTDLNDLADLSKKYNLSLFQHKIYQLKFTDTPMKQVILSVFTKNN